MSLSVDEIAEREFEEMQAVDESQVEGLPPVGVSGSGREKYSSLVVRKSDTGAFNSAVIEYAGSIATEAQREQARLPPLRIPISR
ncbi:hypothetical protein [Microlunatus endophyticus]